VSDASKVGDSVSDASKVRACAAIVQCAGLVSSHNLSEFLWQLADRLDQHDQDAQEDQ